CTWSYRGHGRSALSRHDLALAARTVASTQLCWHKPLSQDDRDRCRDDWQTPQFPRNQGARVVRCLLPVPAGDQSLRGAWLALVLGGIAQPHLQTREGTTPQVGSLVPRLSAPQQPACAPAAQPRLALAEDRFDHRLVGADRDRPGRGFETPQRSVGRTRCFSSPMRPNCRHATSWPCTSIAAISTCSSRSTK